MQIYELTEGAPTCSFSDTASGLCVGASGLDDGCNAGEACNATTEAYYRQQSGGGFELVWGQACRGVPGFMACTDDTAPCDCACDMP